ncbi:MAG: NAD(P)-binding domain-containing protein [Proteobacteria bacterium]|nr:NAD(P)-binding domain-containing protein [Pseudomonadota bacterium]
MTASPAKEGAAGAIDRLPGRIGILGAGHLGGSLVRGYLAAGLSPQRLILSPRGSETKGLAAAHDLSVARDNADLVARADAVLLCVRPPQAVEAVAGLPWREGQLLVSTCAGSTIAKLRASAGAAPKITRSMPMSSCEIGVSPTAIYPDDPETTALFAPLGLVEVLREEAEIAQVTALAVAFTLTHDLVGRTTDWAAANGLDPVTARRIVATHFEAAARIMAAHPERSGESFVKGLATEGGVAAAAYEVLRPAGYDSLWRDAFDAAFRRMRELEARRG